jgi:hypothetical protein
LEEEMAQHVRILAWLFVVFGALMACIGVALAFIIAGSGMISGDRTAMLVTGSVGTILMFVLFALAIPNFLAAWGLFRFRPWARVLAIILAVLHIFSFPLGTALAVYTLWVLLTPETQPLFAPAAIAS